MFPVIPRGTHVSGGDLTHPRRWRGSVILINRHRHAFDVPVVARQITGLLPKLDPRIGVGAAAERRRGDRADHASRYIGRVVAPCGVVAFGAGWYCGVSVDRYGR